jgi:uncharacterized protein YidB (DUF937 family)
MEGVDMGLLNQILDSVAGGSLGRSPLGQLTGSGAGNSVLTALLPVVLSLLSQRGGSVAGSTDGLAGLGGLLDQFRQKGYGDHADSWVGTGENQPLPPHAVSEVIGDDQIAQMAQQAGVSTDEARNGLSQLLPQVVDHLTPDGQVPPTDRMLSSVDDYLKRLAP